MDVDVSCCVDVLSYVVVVVMSFVVSVDVLSVSSCFGYPSLISRLVGDLPRHVLSGHKSSVHGDICIILRLSWLLFDLGALLARMDEFAQLVDLLHRIQQPA